MNRTCNVECMTSGQLFSGAIERVCGTARDNEIFAVVLAAHHERLPSVTAVIELWLEIDLRHRVAFCRAGDRVSDEDLTTHRMDLEVLCQVFSRNTHTHTLKIIKHGTNDG
jgi:hypothetical protein